MNMIMKSHSFKIERKKRPERMIVLKVQTRKKWGMDVVNKMKNKKIE